MQRNLTLFLCVCVLFNHMLWNVMIALPEPIGMEEHMIIFAHIENLYLMFSDVINIKEKKKQTCLYKASREV